MWVPILKYLLSALGPSIIRKLADALIEWARGREKIIEAEEQEERDKEPVNHFLDQKF